MTARLNLDTFWVLLEHALSVAPVIVFAYFFRSGVIWVYGEKGITGRILLLMDDVMVVGVVGWLAYQVGVELWNRRKRWGSFNVFALA